jgi:hypothetical protein
MRKEETLVGFRSLVLLLLVADLVELVVEVVVLQEVVVVQQGESVEHQADRETGDDSQAVLVVLDELSCSGNSLLGEVHYRLLVGCRFH